MDKTLITVDVPNVISVGIILFVVLVLYALIASYTLKYMGKKDASGSGAQF
jgi:hypothetical protein